MTKKPMAPALCVVGSINLDIIATTERLPGPGETVGGGVLSHQPGGKGGNQAAAAARLGAQVRMIGAIGSDEGGDRVLAAMAAAGVQTESVQRVSAATGTALIVVDEDGQNQIAVCPGANDALDLTEAEFGSDEAVLCQLEISLEVVLEAARRAPGFFAINASPSQPIPAELRDRCDLVIVNETEAEQMPELASAKVLVITYGSKGASLLRQGREVASVPSPKVEVVNTIGAGDAFCAAMVLALNSGESDEDALRIACAVGADAVTDAASQPRLGPLSGYRQD
ncbi:ribokinase [Microlunatus phosphovorus NM-1]|uniref:Ribokinase n=1 Tax=Microlunatus phosphovorus (strain ATCC 700054 / DSM 10555 / JCM 9379 / NBRC 101784 / NCIMB 13414 / VKM Ac-1990 / NM-1) TaxID=1032480 RepID=F5XQ69_MICPN|nr:ribokinase [Microlunatus phosphovorus]BAK36900.1 ribokinase [Microlunatus phosphovorus NM-1]